MTTKDESEAMHLAQILIDDQRIACANVFPKMTSLYRWKGEVQKDSETVLILKTVKSQVEAIIETLRKNHSYEVPCILTLPILEGDPQYLTWITQQCKEENEPS